MTAIHEALGKIRSAGFTLAVDGEDLIISPPGRLSPDQRQYLISHKAEIIGALLEADQAGNDLEAANEISPNVTPVHLPDRLVTAARRVCVEVHGDGDHQVQAMLADLQHYPAESWAWLADHFERQLPTTPALPAAPPTVTCETCSHATPTDHPALIHCAAGVDPGNATGAYWKTDHHQCEHYQSRAIGRARSPPATGRTTP